jgi:hypothetical protein
MRTESEVVDLVIVEIDLHDWRRMEELEARRRTCGHVVMLFWQRGVRRGRRDVCVRRGGKSQYACFKVCGSVMWVALWTTCCMRWKWCGCVFSHVASLAWDIHNFV